MHMQAAGSGLNAAAHKRLDRARGALVLAGFGQTMLGAVMAVLLYAAQQYVDADESLARLAPGAWALAYAAAGAVAALGLVVLVTEAATRANLPAAVVFGVEACVLAVVFAAVAEYDRQGRLTPLACDRCNDPAAPRWYRCDADGACSLATRVAVYGLLSAAGVVLLFVLGLAVAAARAAVHASAAPAPEALPLVVASAPAYVVREEPAYLDSDPAAVAEH